MSENKEDTLQLSGGRSLGGSNPEPMPESWVRPTAAPRTGGIGSWNSDRSAGSTGAARISGLHSLSSSSNPPQRRPAAAGSHDNDDSDDDPNDPSQPQNFFAGGERSGISVQGPARGGNPLVNDILKKAARGGQVSTEASRSTGNTIFGGGGNTLGSDEVPSAYIPDPSQAEQTGDGEGEEETAVRHITFWREGFSVEDGPLLRYDVPENARLLNEINTGRAPPSILNVGVGQPVELRVARRTNEDYVQPPKRTLAGFEGGGHRLGSPVPAIVSGGDPPAQSVPGAFPASSSQPTTSAPSNFDASQMQPGSSFQVDHTAPTTSVQVRLADGTRLVARMNLTHTVGDIRSFINASTPGQSQQPYTIATTFPNRVLEDNSITIETAGLKNSVIVQRRL